MSKKKMTVEMEEPFVWPEEPTDLSPYVQIRYIVSLHFSSSTSRLVIVGKCETNHFILLRRTDGRRIHSTKGRRCKKSSVKPRTPIPRPNHQKLDGSAWKSRRREYKKAQKLGHRRGRHWGWVSIGRALERVIPGRRSDSTTVMRELSMFWDRNDIPAVFELSRDDTFSKKKLYHIHIYQGWCILGAFILF